MSRRLTLLLVALFVFVIALVFGIVATVPVMQECEPGWLPVLTEKSGPMCAREVKKPVQR